jgi:cyclopropane fatty-acyl-phospholipid synthase-like methyltransferase
MPSADDAASHYDRVTRAWTLLLGEDLHYGYFSTPGEPLAQATANLTRLMAERAEIGAGLEVLDVGCGTGQPACELAAEYGCHVTGISTSVEGIVRASERAAARDLAARTRFLLVDAMDTGLPAAGFDRAWVMESSHLMDRKEVMLAECARVLRPGGLLALCDIIRRDELPLPYVLAHARQFNALRVAFGRAKMESLGRYADWLRAAGLTVERSEDISVETRPTFDRWRRNAQAHRAAVEALIGADGWTQFAESCDYLEQFWDAGKLGYGLLVARKAG